MEKEVGSSSVVVDQVEPKTARRRRASIAATALYFFLGGASPSPDRLPKLALPINCALGATCFVQQYVDHDPGSRAADYQCGERTYDGHDGTDIRVPTLAAARRGVDVIAAAAGIVQGVRNDMEEGVLAGPNRLAIARKECGNGVLIVHPGEWMTQYCHLARGSINVRSGQSVTTGQQIGRVGLSGDTTFPHLHFTVRHRSNTVDPFASRAQCGASLPSPSLWEPEVMRSLSYHRSELLNFGFSSSAVDRGAIENETISEPDRESRAIVTWVRMIGLRVGDVISLKLINPDGGVMAESITTLDHSKAEWISYTGKKRGAAVWPSGRYSAKMVVTASSGQRLIKRFSLII